jgi:plastocyanin
VSSVPSGTSISYFLSADNGVNWETVTPGVQHDFTNEGRNLKWKAILTTADFIMTPTISEITISYTTALASPELVSPSDGLITDDKTPTFTWLEVSGAHEYNFQLDDTPSFDSPIIDATNASSLTSYTVGFQLTEGTYYWRVAAVDSGSEVGYYSQPRSIIIEQDISPPDIDHPNDFGYLQGTTGHYITWQASDSYKASYNITRDGALEVDDVWTEEEITISVDGLSSGIYVYVCNVYDQFDQFSSDTVLVTVSITQPPTIDDISDFSYEEGTTGYTITWNPSDNNPDWYNVTRNGVIIVGEDGAWDGSSITILVDGLAIGTYTYICTVYDAHGNSVYDTVIIEVIAPIIPTINHPLDFEYESGDTGNSITWVPYDNNPDHYIVELDGEAYDAGIWTGDEITVNVDNLSVGTHTIVCTVFDIHDNTAEDTVIVTIVDTTDPTIDHPSDISYTFGDTGNSITWHPNEINPQNYILTLDGEVIDNVFWDGESITVEVDGLDVGVHTYLITVTDSSGNSASDSVTVTVSEQATTPTTPTPTDDGPLSMLVVVLSFVTVSSLFYYRKKK